MKDEGKMIRMRMMRITKKRRMRMMDNEQNDYDNNGTTIKGL